MNEIEARISQLEFITGSGTQDIIRELSATFLHDLQLIKEDLTQSEPSAHKTISADSVSTLNRLKEENQKLKYRINIVKRNFD